MALQSHVRLYHVHTLQLIRSRSFVCEPSECNVCACVCVYMYELDRDSKQIEILSCTHCKYTQNCTTIDFYALRCYCVFSSFSFHDIWMYFIPHKKKSFFFRGSETMFSIFFFFLLFNLHRSNIKQSTLCTLNWTEPNETENIRIIITLSWISLTNILPYDLVRFVYRTFSFFSLSLFLPLRLYIYRSFKFLSTVVWYFYEKTKSIPHKIN